MVEEQFIFSWFTISNEYWSPDIPASRILMVGAEGEEKVKLQQEHPCQAIM